MILRVVTNHWVPFTHWNHWGIFESSDGGGVSHLMTHCNNRRHHLLLRTIDPNFQLNMDILPTLFSTTNAPGPASIQSWKFDRGKTIVDRKTTKSPNLCSGHLV